MINYNRTHKLLNYIIMLSLIILGFGCDNSKVISRINPACEYVPENITKWPLEFTQYESILSGSSPVTFIKIQYFNNTDNVLKILDIDAGNLYISSNLSSINSFNGNLGFSDYNVTPKINRNSVTSFTTEEVDEIWSYLNNNHVYFFNNEEYGSNIPCISRTFSVCEVPDYMFNLIIFHDTTDDSKAWAISKCVDEYPSPDDPLYGLFQLLEDDFISKFE